MTVMTKVEKLKLIAKENDWDYQEYSGRGMYGAYCAGISGDYAMPIIEAAAAAGITGARQDSLGKGAIVYWPSIQLKEGRY
jgi:hypothetical protein